MYLNMLVPYAPRADHESDKMNDMYRYETVRYLCQVDSVAALLASFCSRSVIKLQKLTY